MKKMLFSALFLGFLSVNLLAQEAVKQDTVRYLFGSGKVKKVGIYIAPEFQYGQSAGEMTAFGGSTVSLLFNKRFAVGLSGFEMADRRFSPAAAPGLAVRGGFGGLNLGYTFRPDAAVHFGLSLLAGGGMASVDSLVYLTENGNDFEHGPGFHNGRRGSRGDEFFVMQPGLFLEANLLRGVKLFANANYKFSSKTNSIDSRVPTDVLNGFSVGGGLKVGFFDIRKPKKFGRHGWNKRKEKN